MATKHSVLAQLRAQRWGFERSGDAPAFALAERQAAVLLALTGNDIQAVEHPIRYSPCITVVSAKIPTSGLSFWADHQWVITLNQGESSARQRFTLLHEYKHIIDHPSVDWLYRDRPDSSANQQAERAADYFAGSVLVPQQVLSALWSVGVREPAELARHFEVSAGTIAVRLRQVGLIDTSHLLPPDLLEAHSTAVPTTPAPEGRAA